MVSTQQNHDEDSSQFKLLTIEKVMYTIVIKMDYTDRSEVNQIKYTINY